MRVLVAGATGVIGRPLVAQLIAAGHEVHALTRGPDVGGQLSGSGVRAHAVDVFDAAEMLEAVKLASPDVVINQLTALPRDLDMRKYGAAMEPTNQLRTVAGGHLLAAASAVGVRRVIVQSQSFITRPEGPDVHNESAPLFLDAPKQLRASITALATMEHDTLDATELDPVVLRYGFLHGPGTYYGTDGANVNLIRKRGLPLVGAGTGITSFVHTEDAATATVAALEGGSSGVYNVTDDEPAPASQWLPFVAELIGAKPPRRVPRLLARVAAGEHAAYFGTALRGNSNQRFKQAFGWKPATASWRDGLERELAQPT